MKAVIFDLDGTLWDTSDTVVKIWNEVLSEKCPSLIMTKEIMSSLMGKNKAQFVDDFFVGVDKTEAEKLIMEIFSHEQEYLRVHGATMYDDVIDTLKILKEKYKLAIVSNCQSGYLDAFLTHYNLKNMLTDYICAGSSPLTKGENIRLVVERNGFSKAIFVGDTKSDMEAATDSDTPFVYASYGFGDVDRCDAVIEKFADIIDVAQNLM